MYLTLCQRILAELTALLGHEPWTYTVNADALARPLIAESLCDLEYTAFGGSIRRNVVVRDVRDDGGNVNDLARSIEFQKLLAELLTSDICRFEIDV